MKKYFVTKTGIIAASILLQSCTINYEEPSSQTIRFSPPLVERNLKIIEYKDDKTGDNYCVFTSGKNSIEIAIKTDKNGKISNGVKSTRIFSPGTRLTARINGHVYRTSEKYFSQESSDALIDDIKQGGILYMEWSEIHGGKSGRRKFTNYVNTNRFQKLYKICSNI